MAAISCITLVAVGRYRKKRLSDRNRRDIAMDNINPASSNAVYTTSPAQPNEKGMLGLVPQFQPAGPPPYSQIQPFSQAFYPPYPYPPSSNSGIPSTAPTTATSTRPTVAPVSSSTGYQNIVNSTTGAVSDDVYDFITSTDQFQAADNESSYDNPNQ